MSSNQRFEKSAACPSNESLLAFLRLGQDESSEITAPIVEHLADCEFCELSLELLRAHPTNSVPNPLPAPPVPEHIRQLFPIHK
jgi:hypothetical protein